MGIKITADVIDYLGKYENGVLVLLSINYKDTFTEGAFWYSSDNISLEISKDIENDIDMPIEAWDGYLELVESILKKVVPYNEIINRLDEVDLTKYQILPQSKVGEDVDNNDIIIDK
ncbi:MAG: hypothetical protein M0R46_10670 [Candidatus Muirbacterium halophilum]|nr:hypothetical protein [Candidatus Muirbacterium halophilum]